MSFDPRALPDQANATSAGHTAPIATPEKVAERLALELSIIIWGNAPVATAGDIKRLIEPALTRRITSALSTLKDENKRLSEAAAFHEHNWQNERDLKLQYVEQVASLTETVGKLRELSNWLAIRLEMEGFEHLALTVRNETRAALTPTEPEAKETTNGRPVSV